MVRCQLILSKSYKCKNGVACFCALFLHKFSVIVFAVRLRAYMETDRSMFIFSVPMCISCGRVRGRACLFRAELGMNFQPRGTFAGVLFVTTLPAPIRQFIECTGKPFAKFGGRMTLK